MLTKKTYSKSNPPESSSIKSVTPSSSPSYAVQRKGSTRIVIKYDAGFGNAIFIRGKGANLSWERGIMLHNVKADEWVWETDIPFSACEFKVLLNDNVYEAGENHPLTQGSTLQYVPKF